MKLFTSIAAAVVGGASLLAAPAKASIIFSLNSDMNIMAMCNDNDPHIYTYTDKFWNKAYSRSEFTKTQDEGQPKGKCTLVILDTRDEYTEFDDVKVVRGSKASETLNQAQDVLFNQSSSNPSKFKQPRPLPPFCQDEESNKIPFNRIKRICFK